MDFVKSIFTREQLESFVRTAFKTVGGYFGIEGYFTSSEYELVGGALAVLIGVIWSMYSHSDEV